MKKSLFKALGLSMLTLLTSCGGGATIDGTMYIGDGFNKLNAIIVKYKLNSVLEEGAKISGSISAQANAEVKSAYTLAYTSNSPLSADSYTEYVLCRWDTEAVKAEAKYELTLDLKKIFPGTEESNTMYFVVHTDDWSRTDLLTYSYSNYKYSWDGEKVKIDLNFDA